MEGNLGGSHHIQSSKIIQISIGTEGLHHCLLICLGMISPVYYIFTFLQQSVYISQTFFFLGTEIPLVICSHRHLGLPVILRVNQRLIVLGLMKIQYCRKNLIFYLDKFQGFIHSSFRLSRNNGCPVSYKTHSLVQYQTVIGAEFRVGLACQGKTLLRHIFISKDTFNSRNFHGRLCFDLFNKSMSIRASQHLHDKAVLGGDVICVYRLSCNQSHSILFHHRLIYIFHCPSPSLWVFLYSRYFKILLV